MVSKPLITILAITSIKITSYALLFLISLFEGEGEYGY
jgi:hypothetical protein